jgi:hypothetical protein
MADKKRIGVLCDYDFTTRPGGAQRLINRLEDGFVAGGFASSYDLVPCWPGKLDRECDAYVLQLTKHFSDEELQFIYDGGASGSRPYMRYELDYWRSIEPQFKWCDKLNSKSKLIVLGSPLHKEVYEVMHHLPDDVPNTIIAYALTPSAFTDIAKDIKAKGDPLV